MQRKKMISVIVPVYNGEKYIESTLNSILESTYKELEIIVINDGSTDSTKKILNKFKDKRIKIYHQENKGVSYTRNRAINMSKGDYITFVDADDLIEKKMYENLIKNIENDEKIVICNYKTISENGNVLDERKSKHKNVKLSREEFVENIDNIQMYQGFLWNKIYAREMLVNKVAFDEKIYILEDLLFNIEIYDTNEYFSVKYIDEPYYSYRMSCNSALRSNEISPKNITVLDALNKIIKILEKNNKNIEVYRLDFVYTYLYYLNKLDKDEKIKLKFKYENMYKENNQKINYLKFKNFNKKIRILRYKIKNME